MAQSDSQKAAFQKMLVAKGNGKAKAPTKDVPSALDMKTGVDVGKGKKTIPAKGKSPTTPPAKGKKPALKIDIMLAKAMPGISMPPKKGKKPATKKGSKKC